MRKANASARTGGRQRRGRDPRRTREDLLAAGAKIFNRDGYYGTDTNRIAAFGGYSPATFYKHFADKRVLFLETYDRWVADEWRVIERLIATAGDSDRAIDRIVHAVMAHHRRWTTFRVSLVALAAVDPDVAAFRTERRRAQMRLFGDMIERLGGVRTTRARTLSILLTFERVCDAVATGEARALGVTRQAAVAELRALLSEVSRTA